MLTKLATYFQLLTHLILPASGNITDSLFPPGHYLKAHCLIINKNKEIIRDFGYDNCNFLPDGRMLVRRNHAKKRFIRLLDPTGAIIWEKQISSHHEFNFDKKTNLLTVLYSEDKKYKGRIVRFDAVQNIDLQGNVTAEWHFFDHLDEILNRIGWEKGEEILWETKPPGWPPKFSSARAEVTHLNSGYRIGPTNAPAGSPFREGNYIFNFFGLTHTVVVLDPHLKKILWAKNIKSSAHDVKVLPNGNILYYENTNFEAPYETRVIELNPQNDARIVRYEDKLNHSYYESFGAASFVNGKYLLISNCNTNQPCEIKVLDPEGNSVWDYKQAGLRDGISFEILSLGIEDLSGFLKNNHI